jgi:hypothetical protein
VIGSRDPSPRSSPAPTASHGGPSSSRRVSSCAPGFAAITGSIDLVEAWPQAAPMQRSGRSPCTRSRHQELHGDPLVSCISPCACAKRGQRRVLDAVTARQRSSTALHTHASVEAGQAQQELGALQRAVSAPERARVTRVGSIVSSSARSFEDPFVARQSPRSTPAKRGAAQGAHGRASAASLHHEPAVKHNLCTQACSSFKSACSALCELYQFPTDYWACLTGCVAEEVACRADCWWNTGVFSDPCETDPDSPLCQEQQPHHHIAMTARSLSNAPRTHRG